MFLRSDFRFLKDFQLLQFMITSTRFSSHFTSASLKEFPRILISFHFSPLHPISKVLIFCSISLIIIFCLIQRCQNPGSWILNCSQTQLRSLFQENTAQDWLKSCSSAQGGIPTRSIPPHPAGTICRHQYQYFKIISHVFHSSYSSEKPGKMSAVFFFEHPSARNMTNRGNERGQDLNTLY